MLVTVTEAGSEVGTAREQPAGKGRPTPKRRDAQKRRRAAVPANKKEAAAQRRAKMRESRQLQRQALLSGDERHLPARAAIDVAGGSSPRSSVMLRHMATPMRGVVRYGCRGRRVVHSDLLLELSLPDSALPGPDEGGSEVLGRGNVSGAVP